MMNRDDVIKILEQNFPQARIGVEDMTGTRDHFRIEISDESFIGKSLLDQHRAVQRALYEALNDGRIHAIQVKTIIPKPDTGRIL